MAQIEFGGSKKTKQTNKKNQSLDGWKSCPIHGLYTLDSGKSLKNIRQYYFIYVLETGKLGIRNKLEKS